MSKLEKLDLMGVLSLAAVVVALALGWIATTRSAMAAEPVASRGTPAVSLTPEGRMKLTVVAPRSEPVTLLANGRMKLTVVAEPAEAVALTGDGRMRLTVTATPDQTVATTPAAGRQS